MATNIDKETKVNLGLAITLIVTILGGAFWIKDSISDNTVKLLLIEQRLAGIEQSVDSKYDTLNDRIIALTADRFYRHEFTSWAELLKAKNPDLDIPEVQKK